MHSRDEKSPPAPPSENPMPPVGAEGVAVSSVTNADIVRVAPGVGLEGLEVTYVEVGSAAVGAEGEGRAETSLG